MPHIGDRCHNAVRWWTHLSSCHVCGWLQVSLTKMLLAVSCLYLACSVPNITARVSPMVLPEAKLGGRYHNLYMVGTLLVHLSAAINSSLNFFFYVYMGSRFRRKLHDTFRCPRCCRPISNRLHCSQRQRVQGARISMVSFGIRGRRCVVHNHRSYGCQAPEAEV
jgi:hypothetical protein